jgi:hypothetical protein
MNVKYTVRTPQGEIAYCVIDKNKDCVSQFEEVMALGRRLAVRLEDEWINVVDYYHDERMAGYKILSVEDTDKPLATGRRTIAE